MKIEEKEALWRQRLEAWKQSGLSQRAFAVRHGYPVRQVGYWARRMARQEPEPGLMPVQIKASEAALAVMSLSGTSGWTLALPADVPATWLAALLRAL
jgi:hypothetical protein